MSNTEETKVYIQDAFRTLVCHVGSCVAEHKETTFAHSGFRSWWTVTINGRYYLEVSDSTDKFFHFQCRTDYGTVEVSFPRKGR